MSDIPLIGGDKQQLPDDPQEQQAQMQRAMAIAELRNHFAAQAMNAYVAANVFERGDTNTIVRVSFALADAMAKEAVRRVDEDLKPFQR